MKRVFSFTFDESVTVKNIEEIVLAARAFPNAKIYVHELTLQEDWQTFVLAESPEDAMQLYIDHCGKSINEEDISDMKESAFYIK